MEISENLDGSPGTTAHRMRLIEDRSQQGTPPVTNLTAWLRMFRPAFQRQFARLPEADVELIGLLRAADERRESACERPPPGKTRPCDPAGNGHTTD